MATGRLGAPGTEYGPCAEACEHTDCAATRAMAESVCHFCGDAIGYERPYYKETLASEKPRYIHAACLDEDAE